MDLFLINNDTLTPSNFVGCQEPRSLLFVSEMISSIATFLWSVRIHVAKPDTLVQMHNLKDGKARRRETCFRVFWLYNFHWVTLGEVRKVFRR